MWSSYMNYCLGTAYGNVILYIPCILNKSTIHGLKQREEFVKSVKFRNIGVDQKYFISQSEQQMH